MPSGYSLMVRRQLIRGESLKAKPPFRMTVNERGKLDIVINHYNHALPSGELVATAFDFACGRT